MREVTASQTARSVAAHRLEYTRAAAGYGDPGADDELSRDVAGGLAPRHGRMHEYLRLPPERPAVAPIAPERCGGDPTLGTQLPKEVLSMRLGKEEAVGYVEDIEAELPAEQIRADEPLLFPLAPVTEPVLPVA